MTASAFVAIGLPTAAYAETDQVPVDLAGGTVVSTTFRYGPLNDIDSTAQRGARLDRGVTLEALRQEDRDSTARYRSNYDVSGATRSQAGWTPPPFEYDYIETVDECEDHPESGSAAGWIKNHYAFCRIMKGERVDRVCLLGRCFNLTSSFHVNILGFGSERDRKVRVVTTVSDIRTSSPALQVGTVVRIGNPCASLGTTDNCVLDRNTPASVEKTLAEWRVQSFFSTGYASVAPPEGDPTNPNRLGYMDFWSEASAFVPELPNSRPVTISSPRQKVRYDTVRYLSQNGFNGAIFSNVRAVMPYPVDRPEFTAMTQEAAHIDFAQTQPGSTIPAKAGKVIPGALDGQPLTRWYFNNFDQNRAEARKACVAEWGPDYAQGGTLQCDEYPFNATHQGAARGDGNFSVRVIPKDDNEAGGAWLGAWYSYDRILDGDAFHVDPTP
ncbi:NucA/NucB deoxyribonuclease domain-containing protein [Actinokineospora globicatena]|uniref:NucA/NucB deoxyribonuclease domain-containing protein n=1 Tax=Actinokineospora globicatena TaxID=103729 RepID=UPI0020A3A3B4|nr:hypothetical protein [Actinokineospora globicatena]MCP2301458.1 Deoxyribonuclease NucA/NucB [Actinokineospora globicatena]GLW76900.1 hypothetical protein Aglo01_13820 [Actinokineospora globicatena]GLW83733.1 hypothetical protein Aglo02_13730 [Actinokineospora globicatena]